MPSSTIARDRFVVASRCAKRRRRRRVGVVVGGHVDRLHRRDRALLRRGDALLQLAHLGQQRRLVADGRRHAAEQRRHFRARLREAEDVVDEEQHVLASRRRGSTPATVRPLSADAQARAWRLGHLAVDQRGARLREVLHVDDAALLELEPEVVAFARALADAGEHRHAAVLHGDVVDQLLDDDGLADAGAAEQPDLAAAQVRLEQVDDLDARSRTSAARSTGPRATAPRGGSTSAPSTLIGRSGKSTGSPSTFMTRPSVAGPTGIEIGAPVSIAAHPALHAVGRLHRDRAHAVLAEVLLDLGDDVDRLPASPSADDADGVVDRRQVPPSNSTSTTGPMTWTTLPTF